MKIIHTVVWLSLCWNQTLLQKVPDEKHPNRESLAFSGGGSPPRGTSEADSGGGSPPRGTSEADSGGGSPPRGTSEADSGGGSPPRGTSEADSGGGSPPWGTSEGRRHHRPLSFSPRWNTSTSAKTNPLKRVRRSAKSLCDVDHDDLPQCRCNSCNRATEAFCSTKKRDYKENVAYNKRATASSQNSRSNSDACGAVNGDTGHNLGRDNCFQTAIWSGMPAWWTVDLGSAYSFNSIKLFRTGEGNNWGLKQQLAIDLLVDGQMCELTDEEDMSKVDRVHWTLKDVMTGRYVTLLKRKYFKNDDTRKMGFCELQIWVCKRGYYLYENKCKTCSVTNCKYSCNNYYGCNKEVIYNIAMHKKIVHKSESYTYPGTMKATDGFSHNRAYCFYPYKRDTLYDYDAAIRLDLADNNAKVFKVISYAIYSDWGKYPKVVKDFYAQVQNSSRTPSWNPSKKDRCNHFSGTLRDKSHAKFDCDEPRTGRYFFLTRRNSQKDNGFKLCELQVFGYPIFTLENQERCYSGDVGRQCLEGSICTESRCKAQLDSPCEVDDDCVDNNMICEKEKCKRRTVDSYCKMYEGHCGSGMTCDSKYRRCRRLKNQKCSSSKECLNTDLCDHVVKRCRAKVGKSCKSNDECVSASICRRIRNRKSECCCIRQHEWDWSKKRCEPQKSGLGELCGNGGVCVTDHTSCQRFRCACQSGYHEITKDKSCRASAGTSCSGDSDCGYGLFCTQDVCRGKTGAVCTSTDQCPSGAACTSSTCQCKAQYDEENQECKPHQSGVHDACGEGAVCATAHSVCQNLQCACDTGYLLFAMDKSCRVGDGAQCSSDSDCGYGLLCKESVCRKRTGTTCRSSSNCPSGAACTNRTCQCKAQYNEEDQECRAVQSGLGEVCGQGAVCPMDHSECRSNQCACVNGYTDQGNSCKAKAGTSCPSNSDCSNGLECQHNKCKAGVGAQCTSDSECGYGTRCEQNACKKKTGTTCTSAAQCPSSAACTSSTCRCKGLYDEVDQECKLHNSGVGDNCGEGAVCATDHSSCQNQQCACDSDYSVFATDNSCRLGEGAQCSGESSCGYGLRCQQGTCIKRTGTACTSASNCPSGATCTSSTCQCKAQYDEVNQECRPHQSGLGSACGQGGVCVTERSECQNSKCGCQSGYFHENKACKAGAGTSCSSNSDCRKGLECQQNKCKAGSNAPCSSNSDCGYGTRCEQNACKKKTGTTCTSTSNCPSGAACTSSTCQCTGLYDEVDQECRLHQSDMGEACGEGAKCVKDHSSCQNQQCACDTGYHLFATDKSCRMSDGAQCSSDSNCGYGLLCKQGICRKRTGTTCKSEDNCPSGATCTSSTCQCKAQYDEQDQECRPHQSGLGSACGQGGVCITDHSECQGHSCTCQDGYTAEATTCKAKTGTHCSSNSDCRNGLECQQDKCRASVGTSCSDDSECGYGTRCHQNECKKKTGTGCISANNCPSNAICTNSVCQCKAQYDEVNQECSPHQSGVGEDCGAGAVCATDHFSCQNQKCACDTGYSIFSDNSCKANAGTSCSRSSDCGYGLQCQQTKCKIKKGWTCTDSTICLSDLTCDNGTCKVQPGQECSNDEDLCTEGTDCSDGKCKIMSDKSCESFPDQCGEGMTCSNQDNHTCKQAEGQNCSSDTEDKTCRSGTFCDTDRQVCLLEIGQQCAHTSHCPSGAVCSSKPNSNVRKCRYPMNSVNCQDDEECDGNSVCDSEKHCMLTEGADCTTNPVLCPAGSMCVNGTCQCNPAVTTSASNKCSPNEGVVGGSCQQRTGGQSGCVDEAATCSSDNFCQCRDRYTPRKHDLSCGIEAGSSCASDVGNFSCSSGAKCIGGVCIVQPGQSCSGSRSPFCMTGSVCDINVDGICHLALHHNCSGQENNCQNGTECDAQKRCKTKPMEFCRNNDQCMAGAMCQKTKCQCDDAASYMDNGKCVPKTGMVGGKCQANGGCQDSNARCNSHKVCECGPGLVPEARRLLCAKDAGAECTDDSECTTDMICDPQTKQCKIKVGKLCDGVNQNNCGTGATCDYDSHCRLGLKADCGEGRFHLCAIDTFCDKLNKCSKGVGGSCILTNDTLNTTCPAGALCDEGVCRCNDQLSDKRGAVCEPKAGMFGGSCGTFFTCGISSECSDDGICFCTDGATPNREFECEGGTLKGINKVLFGLIFGLGPAILFVIGAFFAYRHYRKTHKQEKALGSRKAHLRELLHLRSIVAALPSIRDPRSRTTTSAGDVSSTTHDEPTSTAASTSYVGGLMSALTGSQGRSTTEASTTHHEDLSDVSSTSHAGSMASDVHSEMVSEEHSEMASQVHSEMTSEPHSEVHS